MKTLSKLFAFVMIAMLSVNVMVTESQPSVGVLVFIAAVGSVTEQSTMSTKSVRSNSALHPAPLEPTSISSMDRTYLSVDMFLKAM